jgi:cytochrome c5
VTTRGLVRGALGVAGLAGLVACGYPPEGPAPKPLTPDAVQAATAKDPGVTEAQLGEGEKTFAARCNGCHHYPDRDAFTADQWPAILDKMAVKAKLSPAQKDDVLHFVLASRKPS